LSADDTKLSRSELQWVDIPYLTLFLEAKYTKARLTKGMTTPSTICQIGQASLRQFMVD
jgi:hypothetical protein